MFTFNCKPRYKTHIFEQIRDQLIMNIENGTFAENSLLPSINQFSKQYRLSKVTVGRAYLHLKYLGYVTFVQGKGYFVVRKSPVHQKILFLVTRVDDQVQQFSQGLAEALEDQVRVDMQLYKIEDSDLEGIIKRGTDIYDYIVVMCTNQLQYADLLSDMAGQVPANKLIMLCEKSSHSESEFKGVYQNWENNFYEALKGVHESISAYNSINILTGGQNGHLQPVIEGVRRYCVDSGINCYIIDKPSKIFPNKNELYVVSEDDNLVDLIRKIQSGGLMPGHDIGIISTLENAWKELLGITVFTADFNEMGRKAGLLFAGQPIRSDDNIFRVLRRNSF